MRQSGVTRRDALRVIGGAVAALPFAGGLRAQNAPSNPNIVFIMTDDQRQDAMSAYGTRFSGRRTWTGSQPRASVSPRRS